jgi:hypothetical protein
MFFGICISCNCHACAAMTDARPTLEDWLRELRTDERLRSEYVAKKPEDVVPLPTGLEEFYIDEDFVLVFSGPTANGIRKMARMPTLSEEENFVPGIRRLYMPVIVDDVAAFDVRVSSEVHSSHLQLWAVPLRSAAPAPRIMLAPAYDFLVDTPEKLKRWTSQAFIHPFKMRANFPFQDVPGNAWAPPADTPRTGGRLRRRSTRSASRRRGGRIAAQHRRSTSRAAGGRRRGRGASRRRSGTSRRRRP